MSATILQFFGLLVAIVALATLATRLRLPYAVLLVLGGLLLGFVPGLPTITLNPELILVLFLPPLIYLSAWLTPWREFRASLRPILQSARPGAGDHARHCRRGSCHRRLVLAGRLCPGGRGLAHRRSGGQCDRQTARPASPHRDHNRGREHGQ